MRSSVKSRVRFPGDAPKPRSFLSFDDNVEPEEAIRRLQVNALAAHQDSMGTGNQLVEMLQRAVAQMERSHNRIQTMSTILFLVGLAVLGVGVYETVAGKQEVWAALLGTAGGITALATVFWTAPLDKVSDSVTDLVKLETAFLGYIRVIGEIDSFFQMQYLDIIGAGRNGKAKETLADAIMNTTSEMKDMMSTTLSLLDEHVAERSDAFADLQRQLADVNQRLKMLESSSLAPAAVKLAGTNP